MCCCVCKVSLFIALAWPLIMALTACVPGLHVALQPTDAYIADSIMIIHYYIVSICTYYNNTLLLVLCVLAMYMDCQQLPFPWPALHVHWMVSSVTVSVKCVNIIIKSGIQYHCSPTFQVLLKLALGMSDSAWRGIMQFGELGDPGGAVQRACLADCSTGVNVRTYSHSIQLLHMSARQQVYVITVYPLASIRIQKSARS